VLRILQRVFYFNFRGLHVLFAMLTVNYQTHFSSIHSWRYKQNVYSEFVFVYKLNSYMKAAWEQQARAQNYMRSWLF